MEVVFDYYDTTLYPSEYQKTVENGGYISMTYSHAKGDSRPNLVYQGRKYKTSSLIIQKSSSSEYDGELVIIHTPITNGDTPVYLVIPLKTRPTVYEYTAIDEIIENVNKRPFTFHLGELIGYNNGCRVNKHGTVFMLSPMLVKSTFDKFDESSSKNNEWNIQNEFRKIDVVFAGSNTTHNKNVEVDDGIEGFEPELYDCEPIIQNDGKNKPTVEVMPVTSELAKNVGTINAMTAALHFFIFLMMVIVAAIGSPVLYKIFFVDYITQLNISTLNEVNAACLKLWDYIGATLLFVFSFGISLSGISASDLIQTSIGGFIAIFILISIVIISYYKYIDPTSYSFGILNANINNGFPFLQAILTLIRDKWATMGSVWAFIVGIATIVYFTATFDKNKKKDKAKKSLMMWYSVIFGFIGTVYVGSRIL